MRPVRYSINVTLDGCCHHEAGLPPDEESMRYWTAELERADALLGLPPGGRTPAYAARVDITVVEASSTS